MMSDAGTRDGDYSSGEVLLSSRTHAKALLAPIVVQALVIVLAYGAGRWIPDLETEMVDLTVVNKVIPIVLYALLFLMEVFFVVMPVVRWMSARFVVTPEVVRMTWGLAQRDSKEILIRNVIQVEMTRHLTDRLFGCGTIVLRGASEGESIALDDVPDVVRVKALLSDLSP